MSDWESITRSAVTVTGLVDGSPELINVTVKLSATPPTAWATFFDHPVGVDAAVGGSSRLDRDQVFITPADDEIPAFVAQVDARIAAANRYYEDDLLPKIAAAQAEISRKASEVLARLDAARAVAASL